MGVYISGMEIPKNCDECMFCQSSWGLDYYCPLAKDYREYEELNRGRMNNCPLIEVPDGHGDLIDINALKIAIMDIDAGSKIDFLKHAMDCVNNAPTIIPADKEVGDG